VHRVLGCLRSVGGSRVLPSGRSLPLLLALFGIGEMESGQVGESGYVSAGWGWRACRECEPCNLASLVVCLPLLLVFLGHAVVFLALYVTWLKVTLVLRSER